MSSIIDLGYISCYLNKVHSICYPRELMTIDVYYAKTKTIISKINDFKKNISINEQIRAASFHFKEDAETFISCHGLLRLVISRILKTCPMEITFNKEFSGKPFIPYNPLFFNVTHKRNAFAFAVSKNHSVGIDIEDVSKELDYFSIIEAFFSKKEKEYILGKHTNISVRFFLLWTRKEALLKVLGIGMFTNMTHLEVSDKENYIEKNGLVM